MSLLVLAVAVLAACNPAARAARLRHLDDRRAVLAATVAVAVVVGLAAVADPLLEAGDVSAATWRVGAGLVVLVTGLVDLVRRRVDDVDPGRGAGWRSALVPVAFPVLLEPQVGVLAVAIGADHGPAVAGVATAVALTLFVAAGRVTTPLLVALGRLLGAGGVVAGVALVSDGVLSI